MNHEDFSKKITLASGVLRSLCTDSNPTEEQILEAARRVQLPVWSPKDSFVVDPIRFAIVVYAYRVRLRAGTTIEAVVENGRSWFENHRDNLSDKESEYLFDHFHT